MDELCKLPDDFDITEYLLAFKQLAPIEGINVNMTDDMAIYQANCTFTACCETLRRSDKAVKRKNGVWVVLTSAKEVLVKMNVLPIAIHSGANIAFTDTF